MVEQKYRKIRAHPFKARELNHRDKCLEAEKTDQDRAGQGILAAEG